VPAGGGGHRPRRAVPLALAAYVGALFNLNPLLERDGYHMLVDVLGEPGLRRRAREQFARRLSGRGGADESPVLARYALAGLVWSVVAAGLVIALSLRYASVMTDYVPEAVVWCVLAALWLAVLVPVIVAVAPPLAQRARGEAAA
jgi:putative peptide zinc metalloprotease protein